MTLKLYGAVGIVVTLAAVIIALYITALVKGKISRIKRSVVEYFGVLKYGVKLVQCEPTISNNAAVGRCR